MGEDVEDRYWTVFASLWIREATVGSIPCHAAHGFPDNPKTRPPPRPRVTRILLTFPPREGERDVVAAVLGDEAAWLVDGADSAAAEVALSFWPRKELREAGLDWPAFPRLRYVKVATAGANHVGWSTWPAGLPLAVTPGATGPFIAEYVLGAVIAWARGFWLHTQEIRAGRFRLGAPVRAVSELTVGLVGFGGIGRHTARLLRSLGASVQAVSRSGRADEGDRALVDRLGTVADLPRMVQACDVLVLCCPLTRETLHLVDLDLLSGMSGRPALLVNVSRGPVVKEEDLHAWLDSDGARHFAVLDVWWQYPKEEGFPFREAFQRLPNVVMTPHNAPNVAGFRHTILEAACRDVLEELRGGPIRHVVDPEEHRLPVEGDGR